MARTEISNRAVEEDSNGTNKKVKLQSDAFFSELAKRVSLKQALPSAVGAILHFNVLKNKQVAATWTLDLKNGTGSVYKGPPIDVVADYTVTIEDDELVRIITEKTDGKKAFTPGQRKIFSDVQAIQILRELWENEIPETKRSNDNTSYSGKPLLGLKTELIVNAFNIVLQREHDLCDKMKEIFYLKITKKGKIAKEWTLDLRSGPLGQFYEGPPKNGQYGCQLMIDDNDVILLILGKLNAQRAYMTGKLKLKGNIMLTQKLNELCNDVMRSEKAVELILLSPLLIEDVPIRTDIKSDYVFLNLSIIIGRNPGFVSRIQAICQWNILKDGVLTSQWTVDLKNGIGKISRGESKEEKADCLLTLEDSLLGDIMDGKSGFLKAIDLGKLEITGDPALARKLNILFGPQAKL
ncbi:hydroxysteroid dehydrogenase-like protein 2 [Tachypleus tridentatus]|uniref:hydroxysteroid dehydrogenase-like protein 2 n=1 Tax=Tachypleus tridentatus TaxID=6853 RepID=UPI003FD08DF1